MQQYTAKGYITQNKRNKEEKREGKRKREPGREKGGGKEGRRKTK